MLNCKYNEKCDNYPHCGRTCGLSDADLLLHMNRQIRDMDFRIAQMRYQNQLIEMACYEIHKVANDRNEPTPTCPCGYKDCIHDPAYIREVNYDYWVELGCPQTCADLTYGIPYWEEDEDGQCHCQHWDDEDK